MKHSTIWSDIISLCHYMVETYKILAFLILHNYIMWGTRPFHFQPAWVFPYKKLVLQMAASFHCRLELARVMSAVKEWLVMYNLKVIQDQLYNITIYIVTHIAKQNTSLNSFENLAAKVFGCCCKKELKNI